MDQLTLTESCRILEEYIEHKKERLDQISSELENEQPVRPNRADIEKATPVAAIQTLQKRLAFLLGQLKVFSGPINVYPAEPNVLINIAKLLEKKLAIELQGTVLGEKQKEAELSAVETRKTQILAERKKVLANLRETQKTLESKKEEIEQAKIKELEEKLANARRKYGDMKVHLKNTVEKLFPDPPSGFVGMYGILNVLTKPLQNRERETYVRLSNTMWPFYIELLERHGIIEYHPTDKEKIRIIDFSDGQLGS